MAARLKTLCVNAAMDVQLAETALEYARRSAEVLGLDAEDRARWEQLLERLPELPIGAKGQLLEWAEEFEEVEPGHRHYSHLFGLYPGDRFDPRRVARATKTLTQKGRFVNVQVDGEVPLVPCRQRRQRRVAQVAH